MNLKKKKTFEKICSKALHGNNSFTIAHKILIPRTRKSHSRTYMQTHTVTVVQEDCGARLAVVGPLSFFVTLF